MKKPMYKTTPTYRDYDDYVLGQEYTKGWNDAMDFIFPEHKEKRDEERMRNRLNVQKNDYGRSN